MLALSSKEWAVIVVGSYLGPRDNHASRVAQCSTNELEREFAPTTFHASVTNRGTLESARLHVARLAR